MNLLLRKALIHALEKKLTVTQHNIYYSYLSGFLAGSKKKKSGFLAYYNNENLEKIINGKNQ